MQLSRKKLSRFWLMWVKMSKSIYQYIKQRTEARLINVLKLGTEFGLLLPPAAAIVGEEIQSVFPFPSGK